MPYQNVGLDIETYLDLRKLADKNNRSLVGQIRHMLAVFVSMDIQGIDYLPCPPDANPVPVITIQASPQPPQG